MLIRSLFSVWHSSKCLTYVNILTVPNNPSNYYSSFKAEETEAERSKGDTASAWQIQVDTRAPALLTPPASVVLLISDFPVLLAKSVPLQSSVLDQSCKNRGQTANGSAYGFCFTVQCLEESCLCPCLIGLLVMRRSN